MLLIANVLELVLYAAHFMFSSHVSLRETGAGERVQRDLHRARVNIRVQIFWACVKVDEVRVCNPSLPMVTWVVEAGEFPESCRSASLGSVAAHCQRPYLKLAGEDKLLRLSFDLHACAVACSHSHAQTYLDQNKETDVVLSLSPPYR